MNVVTQLVDKYDVVHFESSLNWKNTVCAIFMRVIDIMYILRQSRYNFSYPKCRLQNLFNNYILAVV